MCRNKGMGFLACRTVSEDTIQAGAFPKTINQIGDEAQIGHTFWRVYADSRRVVVNTSGQIL